MKAIKTEYKGYRFRSRLEARWAVFLDQLEIHWEYEKEGIELSNGQRYLPDFWVPCPRYHSAESGYWLEIKATEPTTEEKEKCSVLAKDTGHITLLVYGSPTNEYFHNYSFYPVRENGLVINVRAFHSKEKTPIPAFIENLREQPFGDHLEIATRFWSGQKHERFNHIAYQAAVIATRSARFEYGEQGV